MLFECFVALIFPFFLDSGGWVFMIYDGPVRATLQFLLFVICVPQSVCLSLSALYPSVIKHTYKY
jgi:hypothetical protein